jgi:hypothetical protein
MGIRWLAAPSLLQTAGRRYDHGERRVEGSCM